MAKNPKSNCKCINHLGGRKQQHHSEAAALEAAIRFMAYNAQIVKCPSNSEIWHVKTRARP